MTKTHTDRRRLLAQGAAVGLLSACAPMPIDIGRQDRKPLEGGIGGTGIVGLLTDFGSLIVNGMRIETRENTQFSNATGPLSNDRVSLGDSLTIEAETRQGRLIARRVHVTHPLIGTVQTLSASGALMTVNGVSVTLEPQAQGRARLGDRVRISGLWRNNSVIASQVLLTQTETDVIAGETTLASGILTIGGIPIATGNFQSGLGDAQFATILGRFNNGTMNAQQITPNRFTGAAGPLKRLSIEGYLDPAPTAPGFKLAGLGHSFASNLNLSAFQNSRTLFDGPYQDTFRADRGMILPESYLNRRKLLETRLDGDDPENWTPIT